MDFKTHDSFRVQVPKNSVKQSSVPQKRENQKKGFIVPVFDSLITISLVAIFFGLPLFFVGITFQGLAFEKQMYFYFWILLALIAWAAKGVINGEMKIRRTPLDIPIVIFWFVYLLATVFSVDRWHSFWGFFGDPSRGFLSITAFIVAYYTILSHFTFERFKKIFIALISSGIIVFIWSLLRILNLGFLPEWFIQKTPFNPIGSNTGLAMFLSMMVPVFVVAIFKMGANEKISALMRKIWISVMVASLGINMLLLHFFYAYIDSTRAALLIGIGFLLIYILSLIVRPVKNWIWVPMVVFILVLVVLMVGNRSFISTNLPLEVTPSYALSWEVAKDTLKSGFGDFFLGSGPASYGYDFSLFRPQEFNLNSLYNLRFYQGNGLFFEFLTTTGVLGIVSFLIFILSFVSISVYLLSREKEKNKIYSLGILSAALIIIISAFMGRIEGSMLSMMILFMALSLAILMKESEIEENFINLSLKASPRFALTLAFVFMVVSAGVVFLFVFLGKVFVADINIGSSLRDKNVTEETIDKNTRAIGLYAKEGRYFTQLGQAYMILANSEALKGEGRDINKIQLYLNSSIEASKRGSELMKNDVLATESLAFIYENAGLFVPDSLVLAEETYKKAQELEPHNPNFFLKLGQIKVNMALQSQDEGQRSKMISEAKDLFQKSIEKKNNFGPGYFNVALAQDALEEKNEAIGNMIRAVNVEPNNVNYLFNLARMFQNRGDEGDNENAEFLYRRILSINDREINTHFYLGLLYEKMDEDDQAVIEYERVLELLPADNEETMDKLEEMVSNVKRGVSNLTEAEDIENLSGEEEALINEEEIPSIETDAPTSDVSQPAEETPTDTGADQSATDETGTNTP